MKYNKTLITFLMISFGLVLFNSCEKKEEIIPDEPFELMGTWTFNEVTTTDSPFGDFTDSSPNGIITFNEDGTGNVAYSFSIIDIGFPVSRNDDFVWVKLGDELTMTSTADETEIVIWTISDESNTSFRTDWTEAIDGGETISVNAELSK